MNSQQQDFRPDQRSSHGKFVRPLCIAAALYGVVASAEADSPGVTGVWKTTAQLVDCVSGQPIDPPFSALNTFYADGNLLEVPYGNPTVRTASFGTWKKAGKRTLSTSAQFWLIDHNGFNVGYAVLERMFVFDKGWQTAAVRAKGTYYSQDDQVLGRVCATATGERLAEPTPF